MNSITKIDQAGDFFMIVVIDKNIPIIGIIMDNLRTQACKLGSDQVFKAGYEALKQCFLISIVNIMQTVARAPAWRKSQSRSRNAPTWMKPCSAWSSSPSERPRLRISSNVLLTSASGVPGNQPTRRRACFSPLLPVVEASTFPETLGFK